MGGPVLPDIPAPLKSIQHYLKVATEHDQRDPVVSYWARLYALQTGLKLSTKTTEETNFLLKLMDWLESTKKAMHDNEAITNEVAAQAHLENWALKLFLYADKNDRASNFGKSVIQSFYTAGILYDVLTTFGELTEEAAQNRKYAKWKAAYIHNCLKNGETPMPGPMKDENEELEEDENNDVPPAPAPRSQPAEPPPSDAYGFPSVPGSSNSTSPQPSQGNLSYPTLPTPVNPAANNPTPVSTKQGSRQSLQFDPEDYGGTPKTEGGVTLDMEELGKAQKYIKWAGSALNYDDVPTAVLNLQKALHLLTTGQDPA
ncbi:vacuolar protein sorting-associated protein VTA1 homolog isoform X2 [Cephus cinctus]|uniref:Vacuolar protein sorting-associated protein VTA1 homolog isoform X2 n=1 Tax=Cephus cinctus TaxID=211228 RepID=A0AAJ7C2J3_CEPCN|nr:vacuolar protein sorting-associated protein VTA1 homolog isoform X2 [Cephus cinctus]